VFHVMVRSKTKQSPRKCALGMGISCAKAQWQEGTPYKKLKGGLCDLAYQGSKVSTRASEVGRHECI
jgi:hypothetical protein